MDVSDIRRLQMRLIIDQRFNGKQSAFAAAIERQPDYVSRCLKGTKRIGEEFAGHVERQLGLPDGWMSGVHGVDSLASSRLPAIAEPEPSYLIEASRIIQVPKLAVAASMGPGADQANEEVVTGTLSIVSDWAAKHLPGVKMAGLRFITGYGESMHPTFSSGDVLLVDTSAGFLLFINFDESGFHGASENVYLGVLTE